MTRNRFRVRFVSLLTILTTAMTGLLFGATAASAQIAPEPAGSTSHVVVVPLSPATTAQGSEGLHWWAIVLIAAAAALLAALATQLYDTMRHRHQNVTFSAA